MDNPPVGPIGEVFKELVEPTGLSEDPDFVLNIGKPGDLGIWKSEDFEFGGIYGSYYFDRQGHIAKVIEYSLDKMTPNHFEAIDQALHAIKARLQPQPQVKLGVPQK